MHVSCLSLQSHDTDTDDLVGKWRFVAKGLLNREVYRVEALQEEIKRILQDRGMNKDEPYIEAQMPRCRV